MSWPDEIDPAPIALHHGVDDTGHSSAGELAAIAAEVEAVAAAYGLSLDADSGLIPLLTGVPPSDEIPASLYQAISSLIAFAYHVAETWDPEFDMDENNGARE